MFAIQLRSALSAARLETTWYARNSSGGRSAQTALREVWRSRWTTAGGGRTRCRLGRIAGPPDQHQASEQDSETSRRSTELASGFLPADQPLRTFVTRRVRPVVGSRRAYLPRGPRRD